MNQQNPLPHTARHPGIPAQLRLLRRSLHRSGGRQAGAAAESRRHSWRNPPDIIRCGAHTLAQLPDQLRELQQICRAEQRPSADTTTNGSPGTTSVHSAGRHASSPASSKKQTRSDCQFLRRFTNSNDRPDNGWNRCVARTRSECCSAPTPRVVDIGIEQRGRAQEPARQSPAAHLRRLLAHPFRASPTSRSSSLTCPPPPSGASTPPTHSPSSSSQAPGYQPRSGPAE